MRKKVFSILLLSVFVSITFGQKIKYLSFDVKVGGGASISYARIDNLIFPSQLGTTQTSSLHSYLFGYHIPVSANLIQFGNKTWRLGLNLGYELHYSKSYKQIVKTKNLPDEVHTGKYSSSPDNPFHIIKFGVSFQKYFLNKNKHQLGVNMELGGFWISLLKNNVIAPPLMYGSVGIIANYELMKNLKLIYGFDFDITGYTVDAGFNKWNPVFFQPRLTIGIRKDFELKAKKK